MSMNGADLIVDTLIKNGVKYVFQLPGGKLGPLLMALKKREKEIEVVTVRHEQNAGFMAQGIGRITGRPGVVMTTSGPGALNLVTPLATATSDGDPVLAISGQVPQAKLLTPYPQNPNISGVMNDSTVTKYAKEIEDTGALADEVANAYITSINGNPGAVFMDVPGNVLLAETEKEGLEFTAIADQLANTISDEKTISDTVGKIKQAKRPVIIVGARAMDESAAKAIQAFVRKTGIPVVETFEATGLLTHEFNENYVGRVGLFNNLPGDELVYNSDLVITLGLNLVEYWASVWNSDKKTVVDIDTVVDHLDETFIPDTLVLGNIAKNLKNITKIISEQNITDEWKSTVHTLQEKLLMKKQVPKTISSDSLHPLEIVSSLQKVIDKHPDTTVVMDGGSHEVWMGSYLNVYRPKHFLMSDGQQTLGVGLPWAISAAFLRPNEKILSSGGDGSFMFSSQELATVAHYKLNIVQVIWVDKEYNMVEFQQELDYQGQEEGVDIDYIGYKEMAESYGIKASRVHSKEALDAALIEAYRTTEPMVIEVIEDNKQNIHLRDKDELKKY
ncbi:acetolactate synthase AlsS [Pediococcus pentosaceus]|uniref:acetolactate synthase AlsS n=1 Tax=Pediococcus pentosaceus TaxID=1255 RepID=UPI000704EE01|nr:acetolactate synthase AlsS [Pediococcus pentosaceus]MCE5960474.1 acetolactate synthase AlsS [Pediococcus pentosaceus]MCS8562973.1 acetolactate synthase AlsS [Pediococcus pentosaceus]MCS8567188.1 acetolactate synthase AlsS [Pediococcus pentosaceus]MCS8569413.1 acetolactate synthase AlsS [Pediococcus pentosaceus]MCS8570630.1 acetolactate synthase AlsS [Pediococcus pentosaceus]